MKTKLLALFSLLVLLLVSTSILADGRPTGIRIAKAVSGGGTNVEIDVTATGTDQTYPGFSTTNVWLGNRLVSVGSFYQLPWYFYGGISYASDAWQYASSSYAERLPWAIDWGDGSQRGETPLFGPPGGPFRGTFSHTYATPGTYMVTVGDAVCCDYDPTVLTGNAIVGSTRFVWGVTGTTQFYSYFFALSFTDVLYGYTSFGYDQSIILAITANTTIRTGFGIPTTNTYGLIALALLLVGSGLLLYRKTQRI